MKVTMTSLLLLWFFACGLESKSMNEGDKVSEAPAAEQLDTYSKAYFASGCFWCVEAIYESVKGVVEVESGYSGGKEKNPTYEQVGAGRTGHAEAVVVYYDPAVIDFATLVDVYYGSQDPTTIDGQSPDFGKQYRSIIFYSNEEEKAIAEKKKQELSASGLYAAPIATEIIAFEKFWKAEDYHQNYEKLHPDNGYVRKISIPRLNRFKAKFPELLK